uniref:Uncharacterized protein n=1 Tax=Timspurckia oligopyrenoides TaxID=708627 RepID=A0A7S0ZBG8_9RHOD
MAIVGVTDHYLLERISEDRYNELIQILSSELIRLSDFNLDSDSSNDWVNANTKEHDLDSHSNLYGNGARLSKNKTVANDAFTISKSYELRLDLLRHTTLFDSMLYSSHIAARLGAWRQTGKQRVQELLAAVGIPLNEARQKWTFMSHARRTTLQNRLPQVAAEYAGLMDLEYKSFYRSRGGFRGVVSAADCVFMVSALLEMNENGQNENDQNENAECAGFWKAYDALGSKDDENGDECVSDGLELALEMQRLVRTEACEIIDRRRFVSSGPFRYAILQQSADQSLGSHRLVLKHIVLFIMNVFNAQKLKRKPFLIAASSSLPKIHSDHHAEPGENTATHTDQRSTWRISSVMHHAGSSNLFQVRLKDIARRFETTFSDELFDSTEVQVRAGQETDFIRSLHQSF